MKTTLNFEADSNLEPRPGLAGRGNRRNDPPQRVENNLHVLYRFGDNEARLGFSVGGFIWGVKIPTPSLSLRLIARIAAMEWLPNSIRTGFLKWLIAKSLPSLPSWELVRGFPN